MTKQQQIKSGLSDPAVEAFVRVMGLLMTMPSDAAQLRVLRSVDEYFAGQEDRAPVVDWLKVMREVAKA